MKNWKKLILPIVVALVLLFGSFQLGGLAKELQLLRAGVLPAGAGSPTAAAVEQAANAPQVENVAAITAADYVRGDRNAKIALIEYSDYECPFCQRFHSTAQQAVDNYDGDLQWIFRHFPLESIHPNARPAAIAAECVGSLGGNDAFWTYTDTLFSGAGLSESVLIARASDMGLDITSCLQNAETNDLVDEDLSSGTSAGVTGTPGNIILNTETGEAILLPGALPYAQVSQAIDSLL